MRATALILLTLLTLFAHAQNYYGQNYANSDAILLEQVRVLTFQSGAMTTGRRSSPLPQLHCVGGSAQSNPKLYPHSVQCTNVGSDTYGNIQWKCEADLDSSVRFGNNVVSCEGYSHPEDPYVLKGSCGLEYTLEYTEQGRANQGYNGYNSYGGQYYTHQSSGFSWGNVFMLVIIGFIVFGLLRQCAQNTANGGGYTRTPDTYTGYPPAYPGCDPSTAYSTGTGTGFRPGFWSGVGTGGLLGYLFRPRTYYGNGYGGGYNGGGYYGGANAYRGFGGNSWGGGGVGTSSSSPRTATGFATTKRR